MVEVVGGDSGQNGEVADFFSWRGPSELLGGQPHHGLPQRRVHVVQQIEIGLPRLSSEDPPAASVDGRRNQFDPFSGNDPRASPLNRRATAYFQYAAWTTISQMLCRLADARHAACAAVTRRTDPRRFVPCHDGLLYA